MTLFIKCRALEQTTRQNTPCISGDACGGHVELQSAFLINEACLKHFSHRLRGGWHLGRKLVQAQTLRRQDMQQVLIARSRFQLEELSDHRSVQLTHRLLRD